MDAKPELQRWSCFDCHLHFSLPKDEKEPKCPECGSTHINKRCPADPEGGCTCSSEVISGVKYCDVCGKPVCPACGCHDVVQVSRVTGYLSEVSGWNNAKQQELKDRVRAPVKDGVVVI